MAWVIGKSLAELSWAKMMPAFRPGSDKDTAAPRSHLRDLPESLQPSPKRGTRPGAKPASDAELANLIEGEIIPRLLMVHSSAAHTGAAHTGQTERGASISPAEAERFALMPLTATTDEMLAEVDALLMRGVSVEAIFVDLLAPSARKLGECWDADICDFVDVTLGLTRLHEVLREVALRSPGVVGHISAPRTALFTPMPGDQHSFGTLMVEEIFNRAGWITDALVAPTQKSMLDHIASVQVDLIGLTLSNDSTSRAVGGLISAIRGVAANPHIRVLVGGRMVNANPLIAAEVGADGTAEDGKSALILADQLVLDARSLLVPVV